MGREKGPAGGKAGASPWQATAEEKLLGQEAGVTAESGGSSAGAQGGGRPHGATGQALRESAGKEGTGRGVAGRERKDVLSENDALPQVLQRSLLSDNMWERKRALQTCSQLLPACEELQVSKEPQRMPPAPSPVPLSWKVSFAQLCMLCHGAGKAQVGEARESWGCLQLCSCLSPLQRADACEHFGSLVGLLAPLTCDPMPASRQLAATCLSSLLRIQGESSRCAPALCLLRSTTRASWAGPCLQEGEAPCTALFLSPPCPPSLPCGKQFHFQKRDFPFLPVLFPAKAANGVMETSDIGSLCEGLHACSTVSQLQTSSKMAMVSGAKKGWGDLCA